MTIGFFSWVFFISWLMEWDPFYEYVYPPQKFECMSCQTCYLWLCILLHLCLSWMITRNFMLYFPHFCAGSDVWKACQHAYLHFLFWVTILRMEWNPCYECVFCLQEHDCIPCDMENAILTFVGWYICSISSVVSVFVCDDITNEIEEIYKPTNVRSRFVVLCSILCTEIIWMHVCFTY